MIEVIVNGVKESIEVSVLSQLLEQKVSQAEKFAVAVNEEFIPKANYDSVNLTDGDQIELVMPMSGG